MKTSNFNNKIKRFHISLQRSIRKVHRKNNVVEFNKEEILLERLQHTLGKSREDINKMVSKDLLDLLAMVPFSVEEETR